MARPEIYVLLSASVVELRQRKEGDALHQLRNLEKHLALVDFLSLYFGKLQQIDRSRVVFQVADTMVSNGRAVLAAIESIASNRDDLRGFENKPRSLIWADYTCEYVESRIRSCTAFGFRLG